MKINALLFLCIATVHIAFAQTGNWPVNSEYVYFGATELDQSNAATYAIIQNKINGVTYLNSPNNIHFRIANSDHLHLSGAGQLGFGIVNATNWFPGRLFEMADVRPIFKLTSTAPTGLGTILFANTSINATNHYGEFHINHAFNQTNPEKSTLRFGGYPGANIMAIQADGNVGIGTNSPAIRLDVLGTGAANTDLRVNGRIQTGDGSNQGGIWVSATSDMFVGQNSSTSLGLYNNGAWRLIADNTGKIAIGTTDVPGNHKLYVNGSVLTTEVNVKLKTAWPDYVFGDHYRLPSLSELEQFIKANKHLPEVPAADDVNANGVAVGEVSAVLLKKIEEMTLYLIELKKENEAQSREISELKKQLQK